MGSGTTKARKIGNSIGVLIPAFVADSMYIKAGTELTMTDTGDEIIIKLKYPKRKAMAEYLDRLIALDVDDPLD